MPQLGQIIPNYLHPHVMTVINDNTEFKDEVAPIDEGVRGLFVFTSPKGRDGVILPHRTQSELVKEYGKASFKVHGQPFLNAYAFLESNKSKAWCMRIMPEDATYSNTAIVAKVKVNPAVPAQATGGGDSGTDPIPGVAASMSIYFEAMQHNNLLDKKDVESVTELLKSDTPDANGYLTFPLFCMYSLGRGVYGDSFRFRTSISTAADRDNDYRNYRFEILELENTLNRIEVFTGTVDPDSLDGSTSLFLEDIINDSDTGSDKINLYVSDSSFKEIFELYKKDVNPDTEYEFNTFNILTGVDKAGVTYPGFNIEFTKADGVALDDPQGIPLSGGGDGSFTYDLTKLAEREAAIDKVYIKAFNSEIDKSIRSKRRVPCEVILDACYSDEVKRALVSLITKRGDAYGYLDAGILNTVTDALAWGESFSTLADRLFSKEFQHYQIRDPFNSKKITVTTTHFLARKLPNHFKTNGNQTPFYGEEYALLTGAIKNTLAPIIDADDSEVKEKFYLLRLNYYEAIAENTFIRGTQSTSQTIWSDLSEENNMHVLLEMKRKLEDMVAKLLYNFAESEQRLKFTEDAKRLFAPYPGIKIRNFDVKFEMNAWEEERSILHCYLEVVFLTMAKRGIIEIDVNKRV